MIKVSINIFVCDFWSTWMALWIFVTMKLLASIHRKRTRCSSIFCFRWRLTITFYFEWIQCIPPSSPKENYRDSLSPSTLACLCTGKQNPIPGHEVSLVFHHQFRRTILAVHSLQRWQCRGNHDRKDCPVICNSHTAETNETLPTDKGSLY